MHTEGEEIHIDETEATGASKEGVGRWVLLFGTLLAIVALSIIWIIPAMMAGDVEEEATMSGVLEADAPNEGNSTDSIVTERFEEVEDGEEEAVDTPLDTIEN